MITSQSPSKDVQHTPPTLGVVNSGAEYQSVPSSQQLIDEPDVTKRDRFELLSAYLDGEVNPEERQLVNRWLSDDHNAKCLYERLLRLRTGIQSLPVESEYTLSDTLSGVLNSLNRRLRLACMAGSGVAVMGVLGFLSGGFSPRHGLMAWPTANYQGNSAGQSNQVTLQVALDKPAFPIPKASSIEDNSSLTTNASSSPLPVDSEL